MAKIKVEYAVDYQDIPLLKLCKAKGKIRFLSYAYHEYKDHWVAFDNPTVHAWMPLPKHYQPQEHFAQDDDLMEHAMFEDDPDWLYKDDVVYMQMTLEEFMEDKT